MSELLNNDYSVSDELKEHPSADFGFLRNKAIEYAQEASGKLWTDYNIHDPGVTLLEAFCYAMTEVAFRMSLDLEELLLHSSPGSSVYPNQLLLQANEVFSPKASTIHDYETVLLDHLIDEVSHVFVKAVDQDMNGITGLYTISVIPRDALSTDEEYDLIKMIEAIFVRHRSIGEDLANVIVLKPKEISIECEVVLSNEIEAHDFVAQFYFALNKLLNPTVVFNSQEKLISLGVSKEDLFETPSFINGFVDKTTLTKKQKTLQLSRLKQLLARQKGVRNIGVFNVLVDGILQRNDWIEIPDEDYLAVEWSFQKNEYATKFDIVQGSDFVNLNMDRVHQLYQTLIQQEIAQNMHKFVEPNSPQYKGASKKDLEQYQSISYDLPGIYRVGNYAPAPNEGDSIHASSKQLTDYIHFFDDILTSYLSQLTRLENLFSTEESAVKVQQEHHIRKAQFEIYKHLLARFGEYEYSQQLFEDSETNESTLRLGALLQFIKKNSKFDLSGHYYLSKDFENEIDRFPIKNKISLINDLHISDITSLLPKSLNSNSFTVVEKLKGEDVGESNDNNETEIDDEVEEISDASAANDKSSFSFDSDTNDLWKFLLGKANNPSFYSIEGSNKKYKLIFKPNQYADKMQVGFDSSKKSLQTRLNNFLESLKSIDEKSEGFHILEHVLLRPRTVSNVYFNLVFENNTIFKSIELGSYDVQFEKAKDTALLASYKNNYKIIAVDNDEFKVGVKDLTGKVLAISTEQFISMVGAEDFIDEKVNYFEKLKNAEQLLDAINISSPKNYHLSVLNKIGVALFKTVEACSLDVLQEVQTQILDDLKQSDTYKIIEKSRSLFVVQIESKSVLFESEEPFSTAEEAQRFIDKTIKIYRSIRMLLDSSIFFKVTSIYARNASIYNYQVSIIYPDWPSKFQNELFIRNFKQSIVNEFPSYINVHFHAFNTNEMHEFEEVYFDWLDSLKTLETEKFESLNLMSSKLLDMLTQHL